MRHIRIALTEVPVELRYLVERGVADQPDLSIVAVASGEIALMLGAARADVVVVAMESGEMPPVAERLIDEYPRVGVVCIDADAGRGVVCRLRQDLGPMDASPVAIAAAIRSAADDAPAWG